MLPDGHDATPAPETTVAPRPGPVRRWGLAVVAVVLVVVVAVGLTWYVAFDSINEAFDGRAGGECESDGPQRAFDSFTHASLVPGRPELAEADRAIKRVLGSVRWRVDVESDAGGPGGPVRVSIVRDGDALEFRRADGTRGRITPDRTLLTTDDSMFSLSTCDDPSFILFAASARGDCVERRTRGDDAIFTYRSAGSKPADCSAPTNFIEHEIVLRRGVFRQWRMHVVTETRSSVDTWTVGRPVELDEPWPWQVVPGWFVNLMAS